MSVSDPISDVACPATKETKWLSEASERVFIYNFSTEAPYARYPDQLPGDGKAHSDGLGYRDRQV
jgi:hypothetical protein